MRWLKKLGFRQQASHEEVQCLNQIRLGQFLEDGGKLLALFEDGREKLTGDYIFDRHYVAVLIARVVEELGSMVYDAAVLVPELGEGFYRDFDLHARKAKQLLADPQAFTEGYEEPELCLLAAVLAWFEGGSSPEKGTAPDTVSAFMGTLITGVAARLQWPGEVQAGSLPTADLAAALDLCSQTLVESATCRSFMRGFSS